MSNGDRSLTSDTVGNVVVLFWGKSGASLHCNLRLQTILCHQTQLFSNTNPIVVGEFHLHLYLE